MNSYERINTLKNRFCKLETCRKLFKPEHKLQFYCSYECFEENMKILAQNPELKKDRFIPILTKKKKNGKD